MLCCVIILGFIFHSAKAGEAVMKLNVTKTYNKLTCEFSFCHVVRGQTLNINVYNNLNLLSARCFEYNYPKKLFKLDGSSEIATNPLKLRIQNFILSGNKDITCVFTHSPRNIQCTFPVEYSQYSARVYVNDISINDPALPETAFQDGHYSFIQGEIVDIGCTNDNIHPVKMEYYNASGDLILSTGVLYEKPVRLKLKVTDSSNLHYVQCISVDNDIDKDDRKKLIFHLQSQASTDSFKLYINDVLIHLQRSQSDKYTYTHTHRYKHDDNVRILCKKSYDNNFVIRLNYYNASNVSSNHEVSLHLAQVRNNDHVIFSVISANNATVHENIDIALVLDNTDFYVTGLRSPNITEEYKQSFNAAFMKYEYSEGEILDLECTISISSGTSSIKWILNDVQQITDVFTTFATYYTKIEMELKQAHHDSILGCVQALGDVILQQVSIQFIYRQPPPKEKLIEAFDVIPKTTIDLLKTNDDTKVDAWVLVLVGFGTGVVIVSVSCFIYFYRKRTKHDSQRRGNEVNYENLLSHPESTLPHPSQWDEPIYSEAIYHQEPGTYNDAHYQNNLEDLYAKPIPKKRRAKKKICKDNYANPNDDQTYEAVDDVKNQSNYADLEFERSAKPKRLIVKREEELYTEVAEMKGQGKESKYSNDFGNSRYVNSHGNGEYAEPAYCEFSNR